MKNHAKYGLLMVLAIIIYLLITELTDQAQNFDYKSPFQLIFMIVAPIVVWTLGLLAKKRELGGQLTYKQGLNESFRIALVYAVVSPFIYLIYYLLINPILIELARTAYSLTGASDAVVITVDMVAQFIIALVSGTIYGAIISLFIKTKIPASSPASS